MLVKDSNFPQRVSWPAILAGLLAGLIIQAALTVLALAVGLVSVDRLENLGSIAVSAGIAIAVAWAVSAYVGGLTTSRAAGYLTLAQGRFNGLLTGMAILLVSTLFTVSLLTDALNRITGVASSAVSSVAGAAGSAVSGVAGSAANGSLGNAADSLGVSGVINRLTSGFSPAQIEQTIADASPNLSQAQVAAAGGVIIGIVNNASQDFSTALSNPADLPNFVTKRADAISKALSGPQFITRLTRKGLSQAQAQQVETAVNKQITQVRTQVETTAKTVVDTAAQTAKDAANTAGKAAWVWLLLAGLTLGLATLGGGAGSDVAARENPIAGRGLTKP